MPVGIGDKYKTWAKWWMARRQNPGGNSPEIDGCLYGTAQSVTLPSGINLRVKVKVGTGAVQTKSITISGTVTPNNAATALQSANFSGVSFAVETVEGVNLGRIKCTPQTAGSVLQIYGDVPAILGFGGCSYNQGRGCYYYGGFGGDLKSASPTINWNEDTTIENDNGWGDKVALIIPGGRGTSQISIVDRRLSNEFKQMVDGGTWTPATASAAETYDAPGPADDMNDRLVEVRVFTLLYSNRRNKEGQQTHVQEDVFYGCSGHSTETGGGGSWTDAQYDLIAASYSRNGIEYFSPHSVFYSRAQWETQNVKALIVSDWESA